jgi:2-(1,2-epoxy-1,2-dihydrophenyl)acetyl-CoA isomerase
LPRLVGQARAKALALLGDRLDAATAAQWGLIHAAVPASELATKALALAQRLANGPVAAQAAVKRLFTDEAAFAAALAEEARLQQALGDHPDHAEGLAAFAAKRTPQYR